MKYPGIEISWGSWWKSWFPSLAMTFPLLLQKRFPSYVICCDMFTFNASVSSMPTLNVCVALNLVCSQNTVITPRSWTTVALQWQCLMFKTYLGSLGRAWASPTLAWLHCTRACVRLLGPTTYRKSLPALNLRGLGHTLSSKTTLKTWTRTHGQRV